jgi:hypothetical protein
MKIEEFLEAFESEYIEIKVSLNSIETPTETYDPDEIQYLKKIIENQRNTATHIKNTLLHPISSKFYKIFRLMKEEKGVEWDI